MHLNVNFSTEAELKRFQDLLYEKSGQGVSFTGLLEAMANEITMVQPYRQKQTVKRYEKLRNTGKA